MSQAKRIRKEKMECRRYPTILLGFCTHGLYRELLKKTRRARRQRRRGLHHGLRILRIMDLSLPIPSRSMTVIYEDDMGTP
jgi:hypothetical protein